MKKMTLLLSAAALAGTAAGAAQAAPQVEIAAQNPVVTLNISETYDANPDMAVFSAGVQSQAMSAQEAMRQTAAAAQKLIDRMKAMGIAARDIQTSGINLNPRYDYRGNGESPRFLGYQASNQVQVKVRDLDRLGSLLDAAVAAGATQLNGPNFQLEDDVAARQTARDRAFDRARERALYYARKAGYSNVRLLSLDESVAGHGPIMVTAMARNESADMAAKTPIEPGQIGITVNLAVQYEMTR